MAISVATMSVDVFVQTLTNLSALLEKGEQSAKSREFDPEVLANARLAPDMFALTRQVQIACDIAKSSVARLAGQEAPRYEDNEKTLGELRERIAKTIAYLRSVPASAFAGAEERDIKLPVRDRTLEFKGLQFLRNWAIPNVFFHVATAYNILRHNGVAIGKRDFLGTM